jgi:hypothetical protein
MAMTILTAETILSHLEGRWLVSEGCGTAGKVTMGCAPGLAWSTAMDRFARLHGHECTNDLDAFRVARDCATSPDSYPASTDPLPHPDT